MLRTIVLLLVIATPLLSQDLLVDSIDREFAGTLIEITDTDIYFQIRGETEPVQYPFWAVKRVTLANGRLAFEDGKTYVAKPTLPVEARPAEPRPEEPLPEEPKPEEPKPEELQPTEKADDEKDKRPPLLSQDLLVIYDGGEYSGKLIEITVTHIYFQKSGDTTPLKYPFASVKRVTLADGSIAYEPGLEPAEPGIAAGGAPPVFSETALRTMALKNADRNHNTAAWGVGGGLLGCWGMEVGAIGGGYVVGAITGYSFGGLLFGAGMGAVVGGLLTAELLARSPISVSLPAELAAATPQLREQYHQLYKAEAHELRKRSVYRGVASCAVTAAAYVGLLILSGL